MDETLPLIEYRLVDETLRYKHAAAWGMRDDSAHGITDRNLILHEEAAMDDVDAVLVGADGQLSNVIHGYEASLHRKQVSAELKTTIKNLIENERSVLEYLAHVLVRRYGHHSKHVSYPLAPTAERFTASIDRRMPLVRERRPDIAAVIERHQPYQPGHQWLGDLRDLTNENKHHRLSPQTRDETRWIDTRTARGQAGIGFRPYRPGKGGVSFHGQVSIGGRQVDSETLQPLDGGPKPYVETIYVDWIFDATGRSVLATLRTINDGVRKIVDAVIQAGAR